MQSLGIIMTRQRLWWARHLSRLPDIYLPKYPLLGARILQETTWSPTLSIQGWAQKYLAEDRHRSAQLADESYKRAVHKKRQHPSKTQEDKSKTIRETKEKIELSHLLNPLTLRGDCGRLFRWNIGLISHRENANKHLNTRQR